MGTDQYMYISGQESRKDSFPFLSFHRTCQEFHPHIHSKQQLFDCIVMLVSQNLSRRHHTSLKTIIKGNQHTHQGHQCFPTSHIPLQQTIHLLSATDVLPDFSQNSLLSPGQFERKILRIKCIEDFTDCFKNITAVFTLPVFGISQNIELYIKELFELKTILRLPQQFRIRRKMNIP